MPDVAKLMRTARGLKTAGKATFKLRLDQCAEKLLAVLDAQATAANAETDAGGRKGCSFRWEILPHRRCSPHISPKLAQVPRRVLWKQTCPANGEVYFYNDQTGQCRR